MGQTAASPAITQSEKLISESHSTLWSAKLVKIGLSVTWAFAGLQGLSA